MKSIAVAIAASVLLAAAPSEVDERGLTGRTMLDPPLPAQYAPYKFHVTEGIYAPGGYIGEHRHIGPGVRIVVKGALTFEQAGKTVVYRQGDVYYESGTDMYSAFNRTDQPVQVINVEILPKAFTGATIIPAVQPAKQRPP